MSINLKTVYAFAREMYPKLYKERIQYGTAGFRGKAETLESCMFRMGLLATLRSRFLGGSVIGAMITASHNPEPDNGIKLIDPEGEMLSSDWESIANVLVNVEDNDLEGEIRKLVDTHKIDLLCPSQVFLGMDNRYHSPRLLKAVQDGVIALKGTFKSFGIVTTPMMHYFVVAANTKGSYGEPNEEGYYKKLVSAFDTLRMNTKTTGNYKSSLIYDGANGVGALKMQQVCKRMKDDIQIEIVNKGDGKINENCGADFVKLYQKSPVGIPDSEAFTRCVSVDGDADRIIYFFTDSSKKLCLLDGDRIATLIAEYIKELLTECNLNLKLGVVQTAYANGGSTNFISTYLNIPSACVPTGVKHLHEKAKDFDIGIYFEANGHGTVLFSKNAKDVLAAESLNNEKVMILKNLVDLINESVGDAISDMLVVEFILKAKGWDVQDWIARYDDLPNIQLKVKVKDRSVIETADADRICTAPEGLQEKINNIVSKYEKGRAFVRPSGTEDFVRVYAEAISKTETNDLAYEIADLTYDICGGIGDKPSEIRKAKI